jgi:hypothetical protein
VVPCGTAWPFAFANNRSYVIADCNITGPFALPNWVDGSLTIRNTSFGGSGGGIVLGFGRRLTSVAVVITGCRFDLNGPASGSGAFSASSGVLTNVTLTFSKSIIAGTRTGTAAAFQAVLLDHAVLINSTILWDGVTCSLTGDADVSGMMVYSSTLSAGSRIIMTSVSATIVSRNQGTLLWFYVSEVRSSAVTLESVRVSVDGTLRACPVYLLYSTLNASTLALRAADVTATSSGTAGLITIESSTANVVSGSAIEVIDSYSAAICSESCTATNVLVTAPSPIVVLSDTSVVVSRSKLTASSGRTVANIFLQYPCLIARTTFTVSDTQLSATTDTGSSAYGVVTECRNR